MGRAQPGELVGGRWEGSVGQADEVVGWIGDRFEGVKCHGVAADAGEAESSAGRTNGGGCRLGRIGKNECETVCAGPASDRGVKAGRNQL